MSVKAGLFWSKRVFPNAWPLLVESVRDVAETDKKSHGTAEEFAKENMVSIIMDFLFHQIEQKIQRTPDDKEIDPESNISIALEGMEDGFVKMAQSFDPPFVEFYEYAEKVQKLRERILIHDGLASPVIGDLITDVKSYRRAMPED